MNSEFHDDEQTSASQILTDSSDVLSGGVDDTEGEQQWMQVGRSNSGRRSQKKKLKNSSSYESFHNPRFSGAVNRGTWSNYQSANTQGSETRFNGFSMKAGSDSRAERFIKQDQSSQEGVCATDPSVSPSSTSEPRDDRPSYRPYGHYYRGRSFFYHGNGGETSGVVRTSTGEPSGDSTVNGYHPFRGRGHPPYASHYNSSNAGQGTFRNPHHSMPFSSRNATRYRYNSNYIPRRPYANSMRHRASAPDFNGHEVVSPPESSSSTTSTTEAISATNGTGDNQRKPSFAATVAAATSPERMTNNLQSTCATSCHMTASAFLKKQWLLYCEQHKSN